MWCSIHNKIRKRVINMPLGTVFSIADFNDIAAPETASKVMGRLREEGVVRKVTRGVYWCEDGLNDSPPPHDIASALARGNMWDFAPSGTTALYLFGIESKPPKIWTYVTDGTYRSYLVGNNEIKFSHTTGKVLNSMSEKSRILVQVIKFYGKDKLSDEILAKIRQKFSAGEEEKIIGETRNAPAWIVEAIERMFGKRVRYNLDAVK